WKPTGRIFKTVGLRWIPTGKIFDSSTTNVDSEPLNGSVDITNQYECEQTLDVSAVLRYDADECDKRIMPTKIELTLEKSQQGVSNDILVSIEGVEELIRNVWINGLKKEAIYYTLGRNQRKRGGPIINWSQDRNLASDCIITFFLSMPGNNSYENSGKNVGTSWLRIRNGKIWVRVLADLPITGKPTEVRMGRGKGNPAGWIARVSTGQIPFEIDGVSLSNARQAATLAAHKLFEWIVRFPSIYRLLISWIPIGIVVAVLNRMRELIMKYKAEKVCHEEMVKMPLVDLKVLESKYKERYRLRRPMSFGAYEDERVARIIARAASPTRLKQSEEEAVSLEKSNKNVIGLKNVIDLPVNVSLVIAIG
nr:ribosomal protein L16, mitochondrial [Tanacetum cinerariifolium]